MGNIRPVVFLGAATGFHEIAEIIYDINRVKKCYELVAILDDNPEKHGKELGGVKISGNLELAHRWKEAFFVFGIGSVQNRMKRHEIIQRLNIPTERFLTLVHPNAKIYPDVKIGAGAIVHSGVVVGNGTEIGDFAITTFNTVIGPYCKIGRFVMVTTSVVCLTGVEIGAGAFIGAGSCLGEGIKIGPGAFIGMASALARNVEPGAYVLGNPPRTLYKVEVAAPLLADWCQENI